MLVLLRVFSSPLLALPARATPPRVRLFAAFVLWLGISGLLSAADSNRMINLSTLGRLGEGTRVMTVGFVIAGSQPKPVLIRGIGPSLTAFGVTQAATDTQLRVFDRDQKVIAENDNWEGALAPTFSDAGAFALAPGSKDAALQLTLAPGLYTAQLLSPSGMGMVEVYDLTGTPKLINLSTRALVAPGGGEMVAGLVNRQGAAPRKVLVRAIGPTLVKFGLADALPDPVLTVFDGAGKVVTTNDDWGSAQAAEIAAEAAKAGAFSLDAGTKDAALLLELGSGAYTFKVEGKAGATGVALVEVYDLMPLSGRTVSLVASPAVTAPGSAPAQLVFTRSGLMDTPIDVVYDVAGSAQPGVDYATLPGRLTLPAGLPDAAIPVAVLPFDGTGVRTVQVNLKATEDYDLGASSATLQLYFGSGTLYLASLRTTPGAAASPAFGSSLVRLTSDERYLVVDVSFSGLSSAQTLAYLRMTDANGVSYDLARLPLGQIEDFAWEIKAGAGFTVADVLANLRAGRVNVQIDTTANPGGELGGRFAEAAGSQTFTAPGAPPALPSSAPTATEAARFLTQATFGVRAADLDAVVTKGYSTWIDEQIALPASLHRTATMADFAAFPPSMTATTPGGSNRMAAWWKTILKGDDQLRQRVAFALSEILVVSDANGTLNDRQEALAAYYDFLVNRAFGDFRALLEEVSLSPVMGVYLSSLRNAKATSPTSAQPDENYAREVMQLFSIGLWQLQPDGTLKLGATGKPVPTYDQTTITETAKVFTGWGFYSTAARPSFRGAPSDYFNPMMLYPSFHDDTVKTIVGGIVLPAAKGGAADLAATLDALVQHPNTGPFLARQLIQRLVTSNPSPAYVYRVGKVFENNGQGVRGDLRAVVKAILLDYEARSATALAAAGQGKLKEPLLRLSGLLRAFEVTTANGRFPFGNPESSLGQAALRSPTVFNFFEPGYQPPGLLADHGLKGPEFQILHANTAITVPNLLYSHLYGTPNGFTLDLTPLTALVATPSDLVARVNLLLCAGQLSTTEQARIVKALTSVPASTSALEKARLAVYLAVTTAGGAAQH